MPPENDTADLYRKPLSPELAATLAAMAEKRAAPKKPKKAAPKRKPKLHAPLFNEHVVAWYGYRQEAFLAEFRTRNPPTPHRPPHDWHIIVYRHRLAMQRSAAWIAKLEATPVSPEA